MKCPGIDSRYLRAKMIKCDNCGYKVEIFSDEMRAKCHKCKKYVYRKNMPSCIDWCKYAKECIGYKKYGETRKKEEK